MKNYPKNIWSFLWFFIKLHKWRFIFLQLFSLAWALDSTLWPYVVKEVMGVLENYHGDRVMIWSVLWAPIIMGAGLWWIVEIGYRGQGIAKVRLAPDFECSIRMNALEYLSNQSYSYLTSNYVGTLTNKLAELPRSSWMMLEMLMFTFIPVTTALVISVGLFAMVNYIFALILLFWMILHISVCIIFSGRCSELSKIHSQARSRLYGCIVDGITNYLAVRLFARQSKELEYTNIFQEDEIAKYKETLLYIEKMKLYLAFICFFFAGVILTWYQVHAYKAGIINISEFIYIYNATFHITAVAWVAGLLLPNFFAEVGVCRQAISVITDTVEICDKPDARPLKVTKGEIKFENVTFKYGKNNNIFFNKNITIPAGQKVGLVGFSGSGKSTFVNLILRFFDIISGRILIDGQDIRDVTQQSLNEQIAMIPQEPFLFHRNILENIRYGRLEASDEEVMEASKLAHCHEFILKMKKGYNTNVGERGIKLSGGQRQRVSIARTILKNAPILILDEATAALDNETERKMQESFNEIMKGKTTIVIAHRLFTLAAMDRILVFKDGYIVEEGNHEELLDLGGYYSKLYGLQNCGSLPDDPEDK